MPMRAPWALAGTGKAAQTAAGNKPADTGMQMAMPLYAPLFIENHDYQSTLTMVSEVSQTVHATVIAKRADASTIAEQVVAFAPHSQVVVQLRDLLKPTGVTEAIGSVQVVPDPMEVHTMAIAAQLSIADTRQSPPTYFEEELLSPDSMQPTEYRAVTPSATRSPSVALLNTAGAAETLIVSCLKTNGASTRQDYSVGPGQLALAQACDARNDEADALQTFEAAAGKGGDPHPVAVDVSSTAGMGTFAVWGIADTASGATHSRISLNFANSAVAKSRLTVFPGVPVGVADLLASESFAPDLALANFGLRPAHVTISYSSMEAGNAQVQPIATLTVPPGTVQAAKVPDLKGDPGMRNSFTINSDLPPGTVIGNLIARGQELYPAVQLIGKDIEINNGGGHPWSIAGGDESTLLLFNHAAKATVFNVNISSQGTTWHRLLKLAPSETRSLDIRQLITSGTPDMGGKKLPPDSTSGDASWFTSDAGNGAGRVLVSNPQSALARNFSCGSNIVLCGSYLGTSTATFAVGGTGALGPVYGNECTAWSPSDCSGQNYCTGCASGNYFWTSLNNSVAPLSGASNAPGANFYGQAGGSATGQGQIYNSSCSFISDGTNNVQVPTASRITQNINNQSISGAPYCPTGISGWLRVANKIVTDQNHTDMVVGGQNLTEQVTIPQPNGLGISTVKTGTATTNAQGLFQDTFYVCSSSCPSSKNTVTATQTISDSLNGHNYTLTNNSIVYSCSSITINGQ
jgi:hypothetical protein